MERGLVTKDAVPKASRHPNYTITLNPKPYTLNPNYHGLWHPNVEPLLHLNADSGKLQNLAPLPTRSRRTMARMNTPSIPLYDSYSPPLYSPQYDRPALTSLDYGSYGCGMLFCGDARFDRSRRRSSHRRSSSVAAESALGTISCLVTLLSCLSGGTLQKN